MEVISLAHEEAISYHLKNPEGMPPLDLGLILQHGHTLPCRHKNTLIDMTPVCLDPYLTKQLQPQELVSALLLNKTHATNNLTMLV